MRLAFVRIENYRCLSDVTVTFDDITVMVGANGSGKSSVLRALDWFFNGGPLEPDDIAGRRDDVGVTVTATFTELTDADRAALGSYATGETATFWRTWSQAGQEKLTGRGLAYPPFETVREREQSGMRALTDAYNGLREAEPALGLSSVRSGAQAKEAMDGWERANPDRLEPASSSATHLFGVVGQPRLAGRFDYVLIPAVSDAEEQTREGRGTLLNRLLERSLADRERIDQRLRTLLEGVQGKAAKVVQEEHGDALAALGERVTAALQQYVREARISLEVRPPEFRIPAPGFDMRVADGGVETDVSRQGHGFQRALLMATLQELARSEAGGDVPAVFLAIEEPELYQHPIQARHFASVLGALPRRGEGAFQVAYATHSAFFVEPESYERLRRFTRSRQDGHRAVTLATAAGVASRLAGIVPDEQIRGRIGITLQRTLGEAVFADVVLLVEGRSDAGLLSGAADRDGGLESHGIAVVPTNGKTRMATAWAILEELGVPVFVVFDGDRAIRQRMAGDGKAEADMAAAEADAKGWNRKLLRLLGAAEVDWPDTAVAATYAVCVDAIERCWPKAIERASEMAAEAGDPRAKPEEWYRQGARELEADPPEFLTSIIAAARALR